MLDNTTKRRIDDCRDILVGKLPDPKAQIEQITIALIYKFMDDMDKEAIELGGEAKFFSGDYTKYSWDALFSAKVTSAEMLRLYSEAIESMEKNPNIPQLFRDILNNAYLPYRDPETLRLFLKTIGEFEYTHSEKLGDAFEYLLSVMGSQGDAGQFRTPRHIIDFLVELVDPKKTDTILDPACGTAGFLISAYKHIKEQSKNQLTPDERKKMIQNLVGYDISPDMVRLSLVNLYLHGFSDPHITEYDTLSSEERWDEKFDVILANPPFMSPKGGIRPHKKFTIKSNRSEVLFVDYIAEHLNPNGRAGIIVPEGVIFQSGTAYKELRKMLVNDYLYAVVSLPAGIFNPYSGVKTSILLMDKALSKKTDHILFVKIDNDGFNLGAQRTAIKGSQLTEAVAALSTYKKCITEGSTFENTELAHAVSKNKVSENGEYNLGGERYKSQSIISSHYDFVKLSEVCAINPGTIDPASLDVDEFLYLDISTVESRSGKIDYNNYIKVTEAPSRARREVLDKDILLSTVRPNLKAFGLLVKPPKNSIASTGFAVLRAKEVLNPKFLYYNLFSDFMVNQMISMMGKGAYPSINQSDVSSLQIPLPSLPAQEEIVAEIEGYQSVIDGAKMVVENYKPRINIDPEWNRVPLGEIATLINGRAYKQEELLEEGPIPVLRVGNFFSNRGWYYSDMDNLPADKYCDKGDLLYAWSASFGPKIWDGPRVIYHYHIWKIEIKDKIDKKFLYYLLEQDSEDIKSKGSGIGMIHATKGGMEQREFPVPDMEIQLYIVAQLDKEQELVNANKQLIQIFEQKIKDRMAKVWGEEKPVEAASEIVEPQAELV